VTGQRALGGVFIPAVTPFDEAGRIDVACLERLVSEFLQAGAAGIVALGRRARRRRWTIPSAVRWSLRALGSAATGARR
jgi:hypothetical protein